MRYSRWLAVAVVVLGLAWAMGGPAIGASTPLNISQSPGESRIPRLDFNGNDLMAFWEDNTPGNFDIFFATSRNGGRSFSTPVNLSQSPGDSRLYSEAAIGRFLYVAWSDMTPGNNDVFFRRSTNGGKSFEPTVNLSQNTGNSLGPLIKVSGSHVYILWMDDTDGNGEIFFRRSTDGGATFHPVQNLSNSPGDSFQRQMAVEGRHVYVVYRDGGTPNEILFRHSSDGGATFTPPLNLSSNPGDSIAPRVTVAGPYVYVTWSDTTPGNYDAFLRVSSDGGVTFGPAVNLSNDPRNSLFNEMLASGTDVHFFWRDTPSPEEVLYRRSTDAGATWGPTLNLSSNSGTSILCAVAQRDMKVFAAWWDNAPGNYDLLVGRSIDAGGSFQPAQNVSANPGESAWCSLIQVGHDVYVAWQDDTPGNREILFRRSRNGGDSY